MGILEEGYGYVLEGEKPISIRSFYSLDDFPIAKDLEYTEKEFTNTLLVREVVPIWKKLCSSQKKFALKAIPLNDPGSPELGWEVQFIHISKLQEVIEKNIDLFRYILGPAIDSKQLAAKIVYSNEKLSDILYNSRVLEGIVLGFGSHNSVAGGRAETIFALSISQDMAPFAPKSLAMGDLKDYFGHTYLDVVGGKKNILINFKSDFSPLNPSVGFSDIKEELLALEAADDPLPSSLMERQPVFIFGAYTGGSSNQKLFKRLKESQKYAQTLLKKTDFLEKVLEKIGGKKPLITCKKPISSNLQLSYFRESINREVWKHILNKVIYQFDDRERQLAFIESFRNSSASSEVPMMMGASKATLKGLKKALRHLSAANAHFEAHAKNSSLQAIVPDLLYSKTVRKGSGKQLKDFDRVRVGYVIADPQKNILFANHDTWLSLSQTIPGFAHGVQGMRVGEKRLLYIHPSLGYGALTTLPPCSELMIKVQLFDIDEKSSGTLPTLAPLDLSWIHNPKMYHAIEQSIEHQPRFIGAFYRDLLEKIEGSDKTPIIEEFAAESLNISNNYSH